MKYILWVLLLTSCGSKHTVTGESDGKVRVSITKGCAAPQCQRESFTDEQYLQCLETVCSYNSTISADGLPSEIELPELPDNTTGGY